MRAGQATRDERERGGDTEHRRDGGAEAEQGLCGGPAPRRLTRQEELPAPGVLLAAQEPRARQQTPDRADERDDHEHAPLGEARDRLRMMRLADQDGEGLQAPRDLEPIRHGRVCDHERLDRGDDEEPVHRAPDDGPAQGAAGDVARDDPTWIASARRPERTQADRGDAHPRSTSAP